MADPQVKVRLTAEDSTRAAFGTLERSLGRIKTEAASVNTSLSAIGVGLSIAGVAATIQSTVENMAALDDAAESTGVSVESLSSLLNTLAPSGVSLEQISDAASKLTRAMAGADEETSKAGEAFKALGISTRDSSGNLRAVDDVLVDVAESLNQYADGTNKTALAQAIFGKSGAALLPLLKDLATSQRAAATVTADQAAAAEELQKSIGRLKVQAEALRVELAGPLITALTNMIEQFRLGKEAAGGFWAAVLRFGVQYGPEDPAVRVEQVTQKIAELRKKIGEESAAAERPGAFGGGARRAAGERANKLREELAQYEKDLKYFGSLVALNQRTNDALKKQEDRGFTPAKEQAPGGFSDAKVKAAREQRSEAERLLETLTGQLDATRELTVEQQILGRIGRGEIEGLNVALEQQILLAAVRIDKVREEKSAREELKKTIEELAKQEEIETRTKAEALVPDQIKQQVEAWKAYKSLVGQTVEEQQKLKQAVMDVINAQVELEQISPERGDELKKRLLDVKAPVAEVDDAARQLGLTFTSAFEDAIAGGKGLSDVLKGLAQDIAKIFIRQTVTKPLADFLTNAFTGLFPARAMGGPVSAGTPYLVGERGPELVVPKSAGTVMPAGSFGGGGVTIVQNVNVGSGVNRNDVAAAMLAAKEAAKAEILSSMRRGGAYAVA